MHDWIHRWMNKWKVVYTYDGVLLALKKSDTCDNMDESWGHYIKWNKPIIKEKCYMVSLIWGI